MNLLSYSESFVAGSGQNSITCASTILTSTLPHFWSRTTPEGPILLASLAESCTILCRTSLYPMFPPVVSCPKPVSRDSASRLTPPLNKGTWKLPLFTHCVLLSDGRSERKIGITPHPADLIHFLMSLMFRSSRRSKSIRLAARVSSTLTSTINNRFEWGVSEKLLIRTGPFSNLGLHIGLEKSHLYVNSTSVGMRRSGSEQ
mmetsp:Transcript_21944/g.38921  ORF Transcript_21944/g.38921 Transcript_21944/m.38921 type:complete len:202 (+) Transcript_21944:436-1041(+)